MVAQALKTYRQIRTQEQASAESMLLEVAVGAPARLSRAKQRTRARH